MISNVSYSSSLSMRFVLELKNKINMLGRICAPINLFVLQCQTGTHPHLTSPYLHGISHDITTRYVTYTFPHRTLWDSTPQCLGYTSRHRTMLNQHSTRQYLALPEPCHTLLRKTDTIQNKTLHHHAITSHRTIPPYQYLTRHH